MTGAIRVLYVDDEPGLLTIGKLFLEKEKAFAVDTLTSAKSALEQLKTKRYDAIISDYQMPEMDGITFLKQLKVTGNTTPFIIFTGRGREEVVIEALNEGADFYLQKGGEQKAQFAELANKIRYAVTRRHAEQALHETTEYLHNLFFYANAPIIAWNPGYRITRFNPAFEHLTGRSEEEVQGEKLDFLFPDKTRNASLALIRKALNGERWETVEIPILTKEGTIRTVIWNSANIVDPEGRIVATIAQGVDITERKQAEDAHRESEGRYRNVVEDQTEFICRFLPDGTYVFVNEAYCRYFNKEREEIIGHRFRPVIHPEDRKIVAQHIASLTPQDPVMNIDQRIIMPDGSIRWQRWSDRAIFDAYGNLKEYQSVGRDITDKKHDEEELLKKHEELTALYEELTANEEELRNNFTELNRKELALKESESRWRQWLEQSPVPMALSRLDGTVLYLNKQFVHTVGYTMEDVPTWEVWFSLTHPDPIYRQEQKAKWKERMIKSIATGEYIEPLEDRILCKDGITRILEFSGLVIGDSVLETCYDLTARKQTEDELHAAYEQLAAANEELQAQYDALNENQQRIKQSEQDYRNILEDLQDVYYRSDTKGNLLLVSPSIASVLGYPSAAELYGKEIATTLYFNPEDRKKVLAEIEKTGSVSNFEVIFRKEDGTPIMVITSSHKYYDTAGKFLGIEGIFRDITERKKAEDALREIAEQYHNVVEVQTEFICRFRPDGTHIFVNEAYCRYFNKTREEIIGNRFRPVIHPEDRKIVAQHIASLTPQDPVMNIDQRIIMPDGSIRWQRWVDRAIFSADGQVIEYQSVGRDITEYKESERALLESKTQLHAVVHGSPIPQFVIDKNHRLVYWNEALEEQSGIPAAEVVGTNQQWRAFYPHERPCLADLLVDGTIEKIPQWYEDKYSASKLIEGAYEAIDFFPKLKKTGTWLHFTAAPIRDTDGNIIGAVETLENVTLQKRAEGVLQKKHEELLASYEELTATEEEMRQNYEELARSQRVLAEREERYRAFFVTSIDCVFITSIDGRWVDFNDSAVLFFGYASRDELQNVTISDLYENPHERKRHLAVIRKNGYSKEYPVNLKKKDGTVINTLITTVPIKDADGRIIRFQGTIHDVTNRKKTEDALRQANRQLNLLSSVTRHDINNQLTPLTGYLEILEDTHLDPPLNEYVQKATTAAQRISSIIQFTEEYQDIGVNAPVWQDCRTLVDTAATDAPLEKIMVKNDLPAGMEVFADPLIFKVYYNLMDNAVRYGGKITTVRFCIEDRNGDKVVVCEDDGDGILQDEKEKIFERGFGKNTGLGLALSREILEITGITIREMGEPGKGARFEIVVPKGAWRTGRKGT